MNTIDSKIELKQTTKKCPACGNEQLLLIRTQNIKVCTDCYIVIPWNLETNQKGLLE
jgi:predicted RNA-binding Zn-ribbon protein involved in translation (DUF1610 family)